RYGSFFFSSRRWHTRFSRDWSSDVCSSDLGVAEGRVGRVGCGIEGIVDLHREDPGVVVPVRLGDAALANGVDHGVGQGAGGVEGVRDLLAGVVAGAALVDDSVDGLHVGLLLRGDDGGDSAAVPGDVGGGAVVLRLVDQLADLGAGLPESDLVLTHNHECTQL